MGGKLKFNLYLLSSQNTPCLTVILRSLRQHWEYVNIKIWEQKQSREIRSTTSWGENKLGNISALARHPRSSCSLPSLSLYFSPVVFSQSLRSSLYQCGALRSLQLFHVQPSPWNVCVYFQMNFSTSVCCCVSTKQIFVAVGWGREWHLRRFVRSFSQTVFGLNSLSSTLCQRRADHRKNTIQLAAAPLEAIFLFLPFPSLCTSH